MEDSVRRSDLLRDECVWADEEDEDDRGAWPKEKFGCDMSPHQRSHEFVGQVCSVDWSKLTMRKV